MAGVQVGPRAVALAAWASKGLSLPAGKVARLLGQLGVTTTPGGVTQRWHGRRAVCSRPTPRWSAAGRGYAVSHGPIVDASKTGNATAREGVSQASPNGGDSYPPSPARQTLTRLAAL